VTVNLSGSFSVGGWAASSLHGWRGDDCGYIHAREVEAIIVLPVLSSSRGAPTLLVQSHRLSHSSINQVENEVSRLDGKISW
jgi:hypothetical protein